jgi:peptidoglycan-N-acetylglucosamine deacetylase
VTVRKLFIVGAALLSAVGAALLLARTPEDAPKVQVQQLIKPADRPLSIGFYVNWDENGYAALKHALPHLDWLIPGWLNLQSAHSDLKTDIDARVLDLIGHEKPTVRILPMIQNAAGGTWDGNGLAQLLANPDARAALLQDMMKIVDVNTFQGVTVDFEELPPEAHPNLQMFLTDLSAALHARGLVLVLAVPFDDPAWDYDTYARLVDFLLLMAYDQHWPESAPGSIAGQAWFKEKLPQRMTRLDPHRTIVSIGNYGYDWIAGEAAEAVTFQQAMAMARKANASINFDPHNENPHFSFLAADGKLHEVWFLNAATAFNEIHAADAYRPAGYALWRLGAEDPLVWSVFGRSYSASAPADLRTTGTGH